MMQYSLEARTKKDLFKDMDFYHLQDNTKNNHWIKD